MIEVRPRSFARFSKCFANIVKIQKSGFASPSGSTALLVTWLNGTSGVTHLWSVVSYQAAAGRM